MDWNDSPEQATFRREVMALLDEQLPAYYRRLSESGADEGYEDDGPLTIVTTGAE